VKVICMIRFNMSRCAVSMVVYIDENASS